MIFDGNLMFDASITTAGMTGVNQFSSGATTFSTNVLDLINARDMGQGKSGKAPIEVFVLVTTAFTGGTSLNVAFQGSTDNVTYVTYAETSQIVAASLVAGANLFNILIPGVQPESGPPPRYYRLAYTTVGAFTTGAVIAGLGGTDDNRYYRPGVVVVN